MISSEPDLDARALTRLAVGGLWLSFPHRQHDDVVYLETFLRCEYVEESSKIEQVSQRFTALRNRALSEGESMELIAEAASAL